MKKITALLLVIILSCNMAMNAHAEGFYNFKLSSKTSAIDYKVNGSVCYVAKNGGKNYENCFYLTPTYFSQKGSAKFRSVKKGDKNVATAWLSVSYGGENVSRSEYYGKKATAGSKYKLQGKKGTIASGTNISVNGRWTP